MQNIYLVKKNYANPPEGDTKPPEGHNSMKFVYHQLNRPREVPTDGALLYQFFGKVLAVLSREAAVSSKTTK